MSCNAGFKPPGRFMAPSKRHSTHPAFQGQFARAKTRHDAPENFS